MLKSFHTLFTLTLFHEYLFNRNDLGLDLIMLPTLCLSLAVAEAILLLPLLEVQDQCFQGPLKHTKVLAAEEVSAAMEESLHSGWREA